jgi:hypothetical protein
MKVDSLWASCSDLVLMMMTTMMLVVGPCERFEMHRLMWGSRLNSHLKYLRMFLKHLRPRQTMKSQRWPENSQQMTELMKKMTMKSVADGETSNVDDSSWLNSA